MMIELSRKNIRPEPDWEVDENGCIHTWWETGFDIDAKFGTHLRESEDAFFIFHTMYYPMLGSLDIRCIVDDAHSIDNFPYIPTDKERQNIISMLEKHCKKNNRKNCVKYVQETLEEE